MPHLKLSDGAELYYEKQGSGPPLFLVPGLGGDGRWCSSNGQLEEHWPRFVNVSESRPGRPRACANAINFDAPKKTKGSLEIQKPLRKEAVFGFRRQAWLELAQNPARHVPSGVRGYSFPIQSPKRVNRLHSRGE